MTLKAANLLGALALTLTDRFRSAMETELGVGGVAASALVLIDAEANLSVEKLSKLLAIGQSSMTRAVQQLVTLGLVEKQAADDRRVAFLSLTSLGEAKLATMLTARSQVLEQAIGALPEIERAAFAEWLSAILESLLAEPDDRFAICRLCDEASCGEGVECPVERGASALLLRRT